MNLLQLLEIDYMGAFKLQHIESKKYLSTTAYRYIYMYASGKYERFNINKALVKNGKVFSTKRGVENAFNKLGKWQNLFQIKELN